jgi:predicted ABC-type ATPase
MGRTRRKPRCIIIAGPNGAGKTTFARDYLPGIARLIHFVNADLIAGGISPLRPELAAIAAGRMVLRELSRLVEGRAEFAFESTLEPM